MTLVYCKHASGFQPGSHVRVHCNGVEGVSPLAQQYLAPVTEVGDRVLPTVTSPVQVETSQTWVSFRGAPSAETRPQTLRDQLLVHLARHIASQLAADVGKSVFTRLIGVKIISSEHCTTGGDGAVLSGSLGLLAGVIPDWFKPQVSEESTRSSM